MNWAKSLMSAADEGKAKPVPNVAAMVGSPAPPANSYEGGGAPVSKSRSRPKVASRFEFELELKSRSRPKVGSMVEDWLLKSRRAEPSDSLDGWRDMAVDPGKKLESSKVTDRLSATESED